MPVEGRLTGCAASDHPDPAVAVGEVVGHLHNRLAGSPQFALVLIDQKLGSLLSTMAAVVHRLLGPDLLLAVAAPHVAGAEHLGLARSSVVVWALCGPEVTTIDDGVRSDERVGRDAGGSARGSALAMNRQPDGSVVVEFRPSPDTPRPMFITGDGGSWRPAAPRIAFPPGSATVVQGSGRFDVAMPMVATEARGRTLSRLDHVPAKAVLVDQLETTDQFVDGPSLEFPPLRAIVGRPSDREEHRRTIDVVDVNNETGSIELAADVSTGDRVQLIAYDRGVAARAVVDRLLGHGKPGDQGVLVDGELTMTDADAIGPIAAAAVSADTPGAAVRTPWAGLRALSVHSVDED